MIRRIPLISAILSGCLAFHLSPNFSGTILTQEQKEINCNCSTDIRPVCVTDGVTSYTYINLCIAQCNQIREPSLRVDYEGFCCDESLCPNDADPTCDSNGQMHLNPCYFEYARCIEKRKFGRELSVNNRRDTCVCNRPCDDAEHLTCDTLGNTHKSACQFRNAKCFAKLKYDIDIEIDYYGSCCDSHCQRVNQTYFPMCTTNGKTYKNFCDFYTAQCVSIKKYEKVVRIKRVGVC